VSSRRAFTLIEVLVVVVVLGIIAAVAIPKFAAARSTSAAAAAAEQLKIFERALENYYARNGHYPHGHWDWKRGSDEIRAIFGTDLFSKETPVGGHYGYVGPDQGGQTRLTILPFSGVFDEVNRVRPDNEALAEVDALLDDGNTAAGRFRVYPNWTIYWLK
jgi:prepilin-type N-terminal cleavage/methylation domain-containing protein